MLITSDLNPLQYQRKLGLLYVNLLRVSGIKCKHLYMIEANIEGRGKLIITNDLNHWERNWCFGRGGLINVLSGSIGNVQVQIRDDMIHTPVSGLFDLMARMGGLHGMLLGWLKSVMQRWIRQQ